MARPTRGPRLGAGPAHERAILRGLSRSLIEHGRVVTTETKAKRVRPYVEKLITKARKGGLHNRRLALSELRDRKIVHRLFAEVGPKTGDRPGGYTRILKLGPRRGDATPMAILELVDQPAAQTEKATEQAPKEKTRRGRLRRRRARAEQVHDHDHEHDHDHGPEPEPHTELEPEPEPAQSEEPVPSIDPKSGPQGQER
jgi:large subunit ribosomal protein L17